MSEEKQIEEMRKEVSKAHRFFLEDDDYESLDDYIADELYNAGYRKQREQRRWQFEDRGGKKTKRPVCSGCGASPAYYLHKSKAVPPYCHECGAPMSEEVAENE